MSKIYLGIIVCFLSFSGCDYCGIGDRVCKSPNIPAFPASDSGGNSADGGSLPDVGPFDSGSGSDASSQDGGTSTDPSDSGVADSESEGCVVEACHNDGPGLGCCVSNCVHEYGMGQCDCVSLCREVIR